MRKALCYEHRNRETAPKLCHTCQRIAVEQDIVTRTVDALLAVGYRLQVNDGESLRPEQPTDNRAAILAELMEVDDEYLVAHSPDDSRGRWVRFVYGNDGYDVISDYVVSLESVLQPVNDYADTLA